MTQTTHQAVTIQLVRVDTALESPEVDNSALMSKTLDWLASNTPQNAANALYYRESLQIMGMRNAAA